MLYYILSITTLITTLAFHRPVNHLTSQRVHLLYLRSTSDSSAASVSSTPVPTHIVPSDFDGPGCVLLAQPGEYDHFLMQAAILIYEHNARGSVGVILGKPSAFTMGELSPNIGVFAPNILYTGGSEGPDTAIMFHKYPLGGYSKSIGTGLFLGGLRQAKELVEGFHAHPRDFKFFFNNVQWAPGVLQSEIAQGRWDVCKAPPDMITNQDRNSNLWHRARRVLTKEKDD